MTPSSNSILFLLGFTIRVTVLHAHPRRSESAELYDSTRIVRETVLPFFLGRCRQYRVDLCFRVKVQFVQHASNDVGFRDIGMRKHPERAEERQQ
ncbi:unnamed protein product, partial [Mycena citricolor]